MCGRRNEMFSFTEKWPRRASCPFDKCSFTWKCERKLFEKVVLEEWWFLIVLLRRVHLHGSVKESLFFVVVERMVLKERWSITRVVSCQEFHCTFLRTVPAVFYMPRSCKEGLPKVVFDWDSEIEGRLWSDCSVAVHFSS